MSLKEEEGEAEVSESQKSDSESNIEDDINSINSNDIKVDFQQSDDSEVLSDQGSDDQSIEEESGENSMDEDIESSEQEQDAPQLVPSVDVAALSK